LITFLSGINILRSYRFSDLKILLLGFVSLIFLAGSYYFYVDSWDIFFSSLFNGLGWPAWSWITDVGTYIIGGVWLLILLTVVIQLDAILSKKIINKQNYFKIFYWLLAVAFLQIFLIKDLGLYHLTLAVVPITFLLSEYLVNSSKTWSSVIVNLLLTVGLLLPFTDVIISSFGF